VFAAAHPDRRTPGGAPVRTYDELCSYLQRRTGCLRAQLPFEGRNVVLYRLQPQEP